MNGPWERYAAPKQDGPWAKFAAPQPALSEEQAAPEPQAGPAQVLRGWRDLLAGAVRGAGSIGATLTTPVFSYDAQGQRDPRGFVERRGQNVQAQEDALASMGADTDSLAFGAGKMGAEVAGTLGVGPAMAGAAGMVPAIASRAAPVLDAVRTAGFSAGGLAGARGLAARSAGAAATAGAATGAIDPGQAGAGAVLGGAMPAVAKVAGAAGQAVGNALSPNIKNPALAAKAVEQYGIPLGPANISASGMTQAGRSVLNDAPFTGGIGARQGEAVQRQFNRAVGETFGARSESLTLDVLDAAKKRMGAEFDRIWNNNALDVDQQLMQRLMVLQRNAAKLPKNEGASLNAEIQDLLQKMTTGPSGGVVIPGEVANKFQSYIRRRAESSQGLRHELTDLRRSIIEAFNRGVSPADAAALTMNRKQYKAFKTVEPLLTKAEAGVAGRAAGDVPAAMLPQAVVSSYGTGMANTPLGDLAQIGSHYIADRVARTGGGPRALIQNSAIGTTLALGTVNNPATLAVIPAAMGAQSMLGSPTAARAMLAAQRRMPASGAVLDPEIQRLLFRAAPVAVAQGR